MQTRPSTWPIMANSPRIPHWCRFKRKEVNTTGWPQPAGRGNLRGHFQFQSERDWLRLTGLTAPSENGNAGCHSARNLVPHVSRKKNRQIEREKEREEKFEIKPAPSHCVMGTRAKSVEAVEPFSLWESRVHNKYSWQGK